MTLPLIHTHGSPASSDDSSLPPSTPIIDSLSAPNTNSADLNNNSNNKRKPSRRSNTAERRATHNAVERARRETLNSRFLDLASLLPNLSQIRRPSKSAIVNSSIALLAANDRFRAIASKELRGLKAENDALRRELNEWRDRAGIPRVEEPRRGEGFAVVLSGEVEGFTVGVGAYEEEEEWDEEMVQAQQAHAQAQAQAQAMHLARLQQQQQPAPQQAPIPVPQHSQSLPIPLPHAQQRPTIQIHPAPPHGHPMIVSSPTAMSFDHNPMYHAQPQHEFYAPTGIPNTLDEQKWFGIEMMRGRSASIGSMGSHHSGGGSPPQHQQYAGGSPTHGGYAQGGGSPQHHGLVGASPQHMGQLQVAAGVMV